MLSSETSDELLKGLALMMVSGVKWLNRTKRQEVDEDGLGGGSDSGFDLYAKQTDAVALWVVLAYR